MCPHLVYTGQMVAESEGFIISVITDLVGQTKINKEWCAPLQSDIKYINLLSPSLLTS